MATIDLIKQRLAQLEPESIDVLDDSATHAGHAGASAGGGHYQLTIISPRFAGCPRIERHRLVYAALGSLMQQEIHALALRTYAPGEI